MRKDKMLYDKLLASTNCRRTRTRSQATGNFFSDADAEALKLKHP
jgi:hypothetical protein